MAFDAALCLVGDRILRCPLAFAMLALEFPIALLATLIWGQLLVGAVEALKRDRGLEDELRWL